MMPEHNKIFYHKRFAFIKVTEPVLYYLNHLYGCYSNELDMNI